MAAQHNKDLKILLVGSTGSGKSSCGNTIFSVHEDNKERQVHTYFGTPTSCKLTRKVFGHNVTIVDTPGVSTTGDEICSEIIAAVKKESGGYNAIVYVVKIFQGETGEIKMNDEEIETLAKVQSMMGKYFMDFVVLLFTFGDKYEVLLQQTREPESGAHLPELSFIEVITSEVLSNNKYAIGPYVSKADNRAVLFDNTEINPNTRAEMVMELLKKVNEIIKRKQGEMFHKGLLPEKAEAPKNTVASKTAPSSTASKCQKCLWICFAFVVVIVAIIVAAFLKNKKKM